MTSRRKVYSAEEARDLLDNDEFLDALNVTESDIEVDSLDSDDDSDEEIFPDQEIIDESDDPESDNDDRGAVNEDGNGDANRNAARQVLGERRMPDPPNGWTNNIPDGNANLREYEENSGPKCDLEFDAPELSYLLSVVGQDFFEVLARNTNINAATKRPPVEPDEENEYASSDPSWTPTNADEVKAYVAINILMGINKTPEYVDCWSQDQALRNEFISKLMTKNRYEKLCQYFHCSNVREDHDENDKIHKVRNFVNILQENFPNMFVPGRSLSIDEAMIKYNGRLSWKQYMPKKPTKWGIKLWCLCDSASAYCLAFEVYTGRGMNAQLVQEFGLGYTVVMGLMNRYLLSIHTLYTDNLFSSLPLATDLLQADTYFCGTLRSNRIGVPRELPNIRLNKYDNVKWVKDSIMVTKWKDKRDVYMLSTNNNGSDVQKQRTKFRREEIISIPSVITDYNARMGGVDHADQFRSYYDVGRTGRRWWKYLFWGLLNIAIVNAYILWELSTRPHPKNRRSWSLKAFKLAILHQLGDGFTSRKRRSSADGQRPIEKFVAKNIIPGHSLVAFADRKKICVMCKQAERRAPSGDSIQTKFGCTGCRLNMCRQRCFNEWHNV